MLTFLKRACGVVAIVVCVRRAQTHLVANQKFHPISWSSLRRLVADLVLLDDGALTPWLKDAGARWIVLRPDRYVFGTSNRPDELEELLGSLSVALETRRQQHALQA